MHRVTTIAVDHVVFDLELVRRSSRWVTAFAPMSDPRVPVAFMLVYAPMVASAQALMPLGLHWAYVLAVAALVAPPVALVSARAALGTWSARVRNDPRRLTIEFRGREVRVDGETVSPAEIRVQARAVTVRGEELIADPPLELDLLDPLWRSLAQVHTLQANAATRAVPPELEDLRRR